MDGEWRNLYRSICTEGYKEGTFFHVASLLSCLKLFCGVIICHIDFKHAVYEKSSGSCKVLLW